MRSTNWPSPDCGREGCAWCGTAIVQPRTGRPRKWCSQAHASAAFHLRVSLRAQGVVIGELEDVQFALVERGLSIDLAAAI